MDVATIVSLVGALGLGSLLTQSFANSSERRKYRAEALAALAVVERVRWAPQEGGWATLREALIQLESAALLARVTRSPVNQYMSLSRAAWTVSERSWEQNPDPETGGGIDPELADVADNAARVVTFCIWYPTIARFTAWRSVRHVRAKARSIEDGYVKIIVQRFHGYGHSAF